MPEAIKVATETFTIRENQANPAPVVFTVTNVGKVFGFDVTPISHKSTNVGGALFTEWTFQGTIVYVASGAAADLFEIDIHRFDTTIGRNNTETHGDVDQRRDLGVAGYRVIKILDTIRGGQGDRIRAFGMLGNFGEIGTTVTFRVQSHAFDAVTGTPNDFEFNDDNDEMVPAHGDTHLDFMAGGDTNTYYAFVASKQDP